MAETLHVEQRAGRGKRFSRQLRRAGRLPAVLYGHGEDSVSLTLSAEEMDASLRHGAKVVELTGDVSGSALLQDIQWDTFFHEVLHVDLLRVKKGEKVTVEVEVALRGEAPGTREGGVVDQMVHSVEIETGLDAIPEKLHININHLEVDQSLTASDIEDLPSGAKIVSDPDAMIVHCVVPAVKEEEEEVAEGAEAEPEVISKGKEEEDEAEGKES